MPLSQAEFRDRLERTLHQNLTLSHPIFAHLMHSKRLDLLQKVTLQGYQLTKNFLTYIEYLFFYCPLPAHRKLLLHNMYEEETGRLSRTKNHVELMREFIHALGISDAERDAAEPLPATKELIDFRMRMVVDRAKYHMGAAAVMIASEGQNLEKVGTDARHVLLGKVFNLAPSDLLFFSVHQKEDVGHVQDGLNLVSEICLTDQHQEEALFAVDHVCKLFYQMYEGMFRAYCEPDVVTAA